MMYVKAFLVGGLICLIGQLIYDKTKFTMGHILVGMVVCGGILGGLGLYEKLIRFAGAGASMPILSFGNSLVKGAIAEAKLNGPLGVLTGMFELTSTGITAAIVFGFLVAVIFKPKG
ncbi:stage V sporulation protein AE [Hydrogenispora ethanolica]|jgi:stage V sporulation protein AE|uniref:Stage V sporulation protein AE n=1 Tax=Hydrogenispora ethanolica TaxID=1082276 RepID=A0A4R1RFH9_HYDET|nr:stage V sporulation protein AE [Hydrogenispora ethanolica]TCL64715.1 stage V sporulation protein AE [Hydrogenispora ethanolica]